MSDLEEKRKGAELSGLATDLGGSGQIAFGFRHGSTNATVQQGLIFGRGFVVVGINTE